MSAPVGTLAQLLQRVGAELLERLQYFSTAPQRVLTLGVGAATLMPQLRQRFPRAHLLAVDRSEPALQAILTSPRRWLGPRLARIRADGTQLPLRAGSIDLICSHLVLPQSRGPEPALQELARVLRPGGLLALATLGSDTLQALRATLVADPAAQADAWDPAAEPWTELHRLGDALMRAGLAQPVMDVERFEFQPPQAPRVSCEVIFGAAFGAQPRPDLPGVPAPPTEVAVPLEALRVRRKGDSGPSEAG